MKISLLQAEITLGDFAENKRHVQALLQKALREAPDVVVLPEMWNIGFFPKPLGAYADLDGKVCRAFLSALAKEHAVNIVGGSAAVNQDGAMKNTSYIFDRAGNCIASYSKAHLFSPTKEDQFFQHGDEIITFPLDGVRCGIAICYDLRFPEFIRALALRRIDILFVVAAWPVERLPHWRLLNAARAVENQIFVAAVNGVGTFKNFHLGGDSLLIDPWGNILQEAAAAETVASAVFDLGSLKEIRSRMHIMRDRRPALYRDAARYFQF